MTTRTYQYLQIQKCLKMAANLTGCIEFPHFGARYPDACCIDGYLWDLDSCQDEGDITCLTSGGDDPCPVCNTKNYIKNFIDNEEKIADIKAHLNFIFTRYGRSKYVYTNRD